MLTITRRSTDVPSFLGFFIGVHGFDASVNTVAIDTVAAQATLAYWLTLWVYVVPLGLTQHLTPDEVPPYANLYRLATYFS